MYRIGGLVEYGAQFIHGQKKNVVHELASALNLVGTNDCAFVENCVFIKTSADMVDREIGDKLLELFYGITSKIDVSEVKSHTSTADYFIPRFGLKNSAFSNSEFEFILITIILISGWKKDLMNYIWTRSTRM